MEPFGGLIETPNIKRIVDTGLTYTNFHTTALCSPTRSSLMTGRNHTTNGMGCGRSLRRRARHRRLPGDRPWAFTGGTIKRIAIDVSGEAFVILAKEAAAAFARR